MIHKGAPHLSSVLYNQFTRCLHHAVKITHHLPACTVICDRFRYDMPITGQCCCVSEVETYYQLLSFECLFTQNNHVERVGQPVFLIDLKTEVCFVLTNCCNNSSLYFSCYLSICEYVQVTYTNWRHSHTWHYIFISGCVEGNVEFNNSS